MDTPFATILIYSGGILGAKKKRKKGAAIGNILKGND